MSTHPLLRAYMAGLVVPTLFVLVIFTCFCVVRFGYNPDVPVERFLIFPLALVPNLWGVWNMLYASFHGRRWLPLGLHGAILPAILLPTAFVIAGTLNFSFPIGFLTAVWLVLPGLVIIYYLMWKYVVGYLNAMLGVA